MKRSFLRLTVLALCLVPTAALAHPGHADGSVVGHAVTHLLGTLDTKLVVAFAAIGVAVLAGLIWRRVSKAD